MPTPLSPEELQKIKARQKQIYFGMVTQEYWNYRANYLGAESLPVPTPQILFPLVSKRFFYAQIQEWRKGLHAWADKPGPTGYDKTTEWKECVLPEIEQAKRSVITLTKSLPEAEAAHGSSDSDELVNDLSGITFDVNKLTETSKPTKPNHVIDPSTFFSTLGIVNAPRSSDNEQPSNLRHA